MKKIIPSSGYIILFILIIFILLIPSISLIAEETDKRDYKLIGALGADSPFSNGTNKLSPILYASYMYYFQTLKDTYFEIGADTTTVFCIYGIQKQAYYAGIKPVWGHTIYGAYSDYNRGYSSDKNEIYGNFIGMELFFKYNLSKLCTAGLTYLPDYHYYKTKNNANMKKPDSHWEHNAGIQLQYKNTDEKNLGIIKHGFFARARYHYSCRTGYSFQDRPMPDGKIPELSDKPSTHKCHLDLGVYYNFKGDYNIKYELTGSGQFNTDRNNAEKIGSLNADSAIMPGYFFAEFYHDRYIITDIKFGIPLNFWQARIEPAFNVLYMPKDNKVIGVPDYPRKYYRSMSLSLSLKIMNLLPIFIDYAYGIDAERRNRQTGAVKKGSHEVRAFMAFAFGKYSD